METLNLNTQRNSVKQTEKNPQRYRHDLTDSIKGVIMCVWEQESVTPGCVVEFAVSCATACSLRVSPLR